MVINIRVATLADIPALQELIRESVSILGAQYYTSRQIASGLTHVFGVDTQLIVDVPFYLARGYQTASAIPIETPDGESLPAFRMEKSLNSAATCPV